MDPKPVTAAEIISAALDEIDAMKPNDRSEKDRVFAIIKTDLEKVYAFAKVFAE